MSSRTPAARLRRAGVDVPALERRPARGQVPLDAAHVVPVRPRRGAARSRRRSAAPPTWPGWPVAGSSSPRSALIGDLEAVLRAVGVAPLPEPLHEPLAVHGQRRVQGERPQERLVLRAQRVERDGHAVAQHREPADAADVERGRRLGRRVRGRRAQPPQHEARPGRRAAGAGQPRRADPALPGARRQQREGVRERTDAGGGPFDVGRRAPVRSAPRARPRPPPSSSTTWRARAPRARSARPRAPRARRR